MIFNTKGFESLEPMETYQKEPSWIDTFKASTKNFTSVSLSHSRDDYYKSEMETNTKEWSAKDPGNKDLYGRISSYAYKDMEQLEALYDEGNIDAIKTYKQVNPFNTDVFLSEDFLKYKELQGQQGLKPVSQIREDINTRAVKDFEESSQVIAQSDSLSAELAGTMYGALHDTKTLQTLPLGTWKAGGTVMANAGRAIAEEMGIEALAQVSIAPEVYSFKKEIGLKTSVANEAYNAVASIATAGLVRGAGSATFDLTAKGVKALKAKDPELAQDYINLSKDQPTQDLKTHTDNMNKVEFSGEPLDKITNPNEKGIELNEAKPISEVDEIVFADKDFTTVYHGTDKVFDEFDITKAGDTQGLDKDVVFFTTDKDRASTFDARYPQKPKYRYTEEDKIAVQKAEESVKTVDINTKDILTLNDVKDLYKQGKIKTEPKTDDLFRAESGHDMNRESIKEAIEATGKKVFSFTREGETQYAVYDTDVIKRKQDVNELDDMRIVVDKDIEGEVTTRSYTEINQELDENDIMFKKIQDCLLGVE